MTKSESLRKQIAALDDISSEFDRLQTAASDDVEAQRFLETKLMLGDIRFIRQRELDELLAGRSLDYPLTPEQVQGVQDLLQQLHGYTKKDLTISTAMNLLRQIVNAASQQPQSPTGLNSQATSPFTTGVLPPLPQKKTE
jgi:hypothetical protein